MKKSLVIGVTGGVGAGKSRVLKYLQEKWDADILVLDDVSREMLEIGGLCYDETIALFGTLSFRTGDWTAHRSPGSSFPMKK